MNHHIPKVIYQTWKTKKLHPNVKKVINSMKLINPEYKFVLYDDDDIDEFISNEFSGVEYQAFKRLNAGAAKADFWRYCILYKYGGIYLDIDSEITGNLDNLINFDDDCIITRENNRPFFNNWFLISKANHPLFDLIIKKTVDNIFNRTSDNVAQLTGPHGPVTKAVNEVFDLNNDENLEIYDLDDKTLNNIYKNKNNKYNLRIYGVDMNHFGRFKHQYVEDLFRNHLRWKFNVALNKNAYYSPLTYWVKKIRGYLFLFYKYMFKLKNKLIRLLF